MTKQMTDAQRRAVESVDGDLAISAGAGSGKTTVLSHRFAKALSDTARAPWAPAEVDRILTITFTNKAAGEIAERVRKVVNAEVSVEAGRGVSEAWISTIHTFCGRLVRRHLLEAGVDPRFTQIDEVTASLLKAEAFEASASRLYGDHEGATVLLDSASLSQLRDDVVVVHDNVRAMGLDPRDARVPDGRDDLEMLKLEVHERAETLLAGVAACKQTPKLIEKRESLEAWCAALGGCALGDEDACDTLVGLWTTYDISRLPADVTAANHELKDALERLAQAAFAVLRSREIEGFEALVHAFAEEYAHLKRERSAIDFDDLQELAAELLENNPALAARYRSHFRMLMIDEFQDTNDLQMRVLEPLRDENLCVVGDERQSIYGFRYADVEIFERIRGEIEHVEELKHNFRSHPAILDFVNAAFSQPHLFGSSFMQLIPGREGPWGPVVPEGEPRVECLLVDTAGSYKSDSVATEANAVAERIADLIGNGVQGGEIAVLLRNATNASVFAAAIEARGVPVLVSAGVELFDATETQEVIWLLRAMAVPGDDEALAAVLASRMVGLTDDGLLTLRELADRGPLWSALEAIGEGGSDAAELTPDDLVAARKAHRVLRDAGLRQGAVTMHELIHDVCEAFDYDLTLFSAGPQGLRAWANVLKIVRYAEQYEAVESSDVAAFAEYLRQRSDGSKDKAAPAEAGADVVRVMTVHAAKGLEFPVVFAADLGANKIHGSGGVLVAKDPDGEKAALVGVKLPGGDEKVKAATVLYQRLCASQQTKDLEEQKRCLYVACTRAEEQLVVSGSTRLSTPAGEGKSIVDWIRDSLGDPVADSVVSCGDAEVAVTVLESSAQDAAMREVALRPGAPLAVEAEQRSATVPTPTRPRRVSYSSMHTHEQCPLSYQVRSVAPLGEFQDPARLSANEFGSALHAVMQTAGPHGPAEGALDTAVRRYRLDADAAERLGQAVSAFLASPLAARVADSEHVAREEPIRLAIGETALVGNVDVLAWKGEEALIVDYKTGMAPSAGTPSRQAGYELQAKCYALAAFAAGATAVEAVFCFVEHGPSEVAFTFDATDAARIRDELEARIQRMAADTQTHLAAYDADVCYACPALGGVCPVDPPEAARS